MNNPVSESSARVFLCYARNDGDLADLARSALAAAGLAITDQIWHPDNAGYITSRLRDLVQPGDVVVVLLTESASASQWVDPDIGTAISADIDSQGSDIIAVLVDSIKIPDAFRDRTLIDMASEMSTGLWQLVSDVKVATSVHFSNLTRREFSRLVADLLRARRFHVEESQHAVHSNVDLQATYYYTDPFGTVDAENWLVYVRLCRSVIFAAGDFPDVPSSAMGPGTRCTLLATNAYVREAALKSITDSARHANIRFKALCGPDLRRLLRQHSEIAAKYFN